MSVAASTTTDLRALELRLTARIDAARSEAKADLQREIAMVRLEIETARYETLRWIAVVLMVLQTGVLFGLLIRGL